MPLARITKRHRLQMQRAELKRFSSLSLTCTIPARGHIGSSPTFIRCLEVNLDHSIQLAVPLFWDSDIEALIVQRVTVNPVQAQQLIRWHAAYNYHAINLLTRKLCKMQGEKKRG